jgi:hypothetical protein
MNHRNLLDEGLLDFLINKILPGAQKAAERKHLQKKTKKLKKYEKKLADLDQKIDATQKEFIDQFEKETGTRDIDKYWEDYLDRTGRRI